MPPDALSHDAARPPVLTTERWLPAPLPPLPAVLATNGRRAWAALADGSIFASDDAGATWTAAPAGPLVAEPLALLATPHALLAATEAGVLRAKHGSGWQPATAGLPDGEVVTTLVRSGTILLAGTLSSGAFRSTDGGANWTPANDGLPFRDHGLAVFALAAGRGAQFAAHPLGLSRSTDAGVSWTNASYGLPPSILLTTVYAGRTVWASGGGAIFRSDDGHQWRGVYACGDHGPLVLISCAGGRLVARAADGAALFASRDGGVTWRSFDGGLTPDAFATHGIFVQQTLLLSTVPDGVWRRPIGHGRAVAPPVELLPGATASHGEVAFNLRGATDVVLTVHDISGAEVARLAEGAHERGLHRFHLDSEFPPGVYEWRLTGDGCRQIHSFIIVR